jgi:hypothetical protein
LFLHEAPAYKREAGPGTSWRVAMEHGNHGNRRQGEQPPEEAR